MAISSGVHQPVRRRTTLADVARVSGVSVAAASQVLSGQKGATRYSPATAARVREAARLLRYRPSLAGRIIRQGRTGIMGLVLPALADAYVTSLAPGCITAATRCGYELIVSAAHLASDEYQQRVSHLLDLDVDGLVLFASQELIRSEVYRELVESRRPVVLLEHDTADQNVDFVGMDDLANYRQAVGRLKSLGHQRIGLIYELEYAVPSAHVRRLAFEQAVDELGLPVLPRYCIQTAHHRDAQSLAALTPVLEAKGDLTALVVRGHWRMEWMYQALLEWGWAVPDDVSLVNISGHDYRRDRLRITAVQTPIAKMGEQAVQLLTHRIGHPDDPPQRILLPGELIEGTTVKNC